MAILFDFVSVVFVSGNKKQLGQVPLEVDTFCYILLPRPKDRCTVVVKYFSFYLLVVRLILLKRWFLKIDL